MQMERRGSFARLAAWLLIAAVAVVLAGCGNRPARLLRQAEKAEKAARAAQERGDVAGANLAAADAADAVGQLEKLVEEDKAGSPDLRQALAKARAAERAAREYAALAQEEKALRDKLASLKIRAYQKVQAAVLTTVVPPMAAVADKTGQIGTNALSMVERPVAEQAWRLVSLIGGRAPLPDGRADWPGVAADLRNWSTNPPMEFRAFLALAYVYAGASDFALAEFESVDPRSLSRTNALRIYHGGRALLYATHGWSRLTAREVAAFSRYAGPPEGPMVARQILALMQTYLAYDALTKRDFETMDARITQSLQAWPDNPLVVFLTGERLAANGEWEKAATSLESVATGAKDEWLAKLLAQRARDLRDGRGSAKAMVMDGQFLTDVAAHYAFNAAMNSPAAKKLGAAMDEAKSFGKELWQKIPLLGAPPDEANSTNK